ncbi:MAG: ABC transporter permease [Candidatus Komeilibacteria bacterium]
MKLRHNLQTSVVGLRTNKSRAALTILGIVIGIMSIMIIVSLGQGAQNLIIGEISSVGAKTITIAPGKQPKSASDALSMFSDSLKERDLAAILNKANVPYLAKVMPLVFGVQTASYGNEIYRPTIYGANPLFSDIYDIQLSQGNYFTEEDVKGYADVAIIGSKMRDELFANSDPIGQRIRIRGRNLRVIGVMAAKGQSSFVNFDSAVVMPYTTAQRYIFGFKHFQHIIVQADSEERVAATVQDLKSTIRINHGITDPGKDDFYIETQADTMAMVKTVTDVLTMLLAAVAAISLLVGGIGIMNIMLVSVKERTREIGLRKAVGATQGDILTQFLLESVALTGLGGLIGIILGTVFSYLIIVIIAKYAGFAWSFTFPVSAAILGLAVSSIVGLVFGLYPARQAAIKNPIEALRYE